MVYTERYLWFQPVFLLHKQSSIGTEYRVCVLLVPKETKNSIYKIYAYEVIKYHGKFNIHTVYHEIFEVENFCNFFCKVFHMNLTPICEFA